MQINKALLYLFIITFILSSCKQPENLAGIYTANSSVMGNGLVYAWVKVDNFKRPKSIGFTFNAEALSGLDTSSSGHTAGGHNSNIIELEMPENIENIVFNQIVINYNPKGHVPIGIYDKPHFDFHFYSGTTAERKAIPTYAQDSLKFKNLPAKDYFPPNFFNPGGGDPEMGTHSIDIKGSELTGSPFEQTFVYGSYDGKINFIEPMITYDFIKKTTRFTRSIPRPAKVMVTGYYPQIMSLTKTDGNYILALEYFEYRTAE